ncbi:ribosomal RNA small subunit methyltransferase I [Pilimelia anulata]|uniref:Ribosomal RNA small subunit methyltransferase I n=1 Tax=Pilimelia anulata TaxID=53371 RepID=A0A8J3B868_9ACTN|nr:16S rRNA (cytidine(1402)-2'-O)-methyltransferase [Pilimelia anulata]GGJ92394.1 ribosomal RNA small subunit methyltransferase I [Pilimelia anulata]
MADGRLVLLGAPLGNPGDASPRLRAALGSAAIVAAEDTRRLARLARDLDVAITGRVVSYFDGNEARRAAELVAEVAAGAEVAVITDAGMPSVSDPGYRLVRAVLDAGLPVAVVPGRPSAVTTALALSGLPCDRFCFEGFLPRRGGERRARLAELAAERRTMVLFEAPHRLAAALADLAAAFGGERPAAVCRELTKTYEEVRRGSLGALAGAVDGERVRGEITLVVAGAPERVVALSAGELRAAVEQRVAGGASRRDAIAAVAAETGVPRREVYAAAVGG